MYFELLVFVAVAAASFDFFAIVVVIDVGLRHCAVLD